MAATGQPGTVASLNPARILDTRTGLGAPKQPVAAGTSIAVQVTGRGGVPATGVSAVVVNVTATRPTASGHVIAYPDNTTRPTTSNLNFVAGQTIPNLVIVPVGSNGKIRLYNASGSTDLLADVSGYVRAGTSTQPGTVASLNPARILDTRTGLGAPKQPVAAGTSIAVQVTGRGGVPATGVSAVVVNVTATRPTASGHVIAYPDNTTRPTTSNLNFVAGQTIPNLVIVPVGSNGKIRLYNASGSTDLLADVSGYVRAGTSTQPGTVASLNPARILDTRTGLGAPKQPVAAGTSIAVQVTGRGGVPATGVSAVVVNVTATRPTASGHVIAYPDNTTRPTTSNLNFVAGQTIPNLVIVPVGSTGKIRLYNANGSTDLLADVSGYVRAIGITPTSLPTGKVGLNYMAALVATGGTEPYTWSASGLPSTLTLEPGGTISGVPTATSTSTVAIHVTDATGSTAAQSATLVVDVGLPSQCTGAAGCVDTKSQPRTVQVPAERIGEIATDVEGNAVSVRLTGAPPAIDDVLVLAPNERFPSGAIVVVTGASAQPDGTTAVDVVPGTFADAYHEGAVSVSGTLDSDDIEPPQPPLAPDHASVLLGEAAKLQKATTQRSTLASGVDVTSASSIECDDPTITTDLYGLSVDPSLTPTLAALWKHPLFGGGGIYVGTGGLELFQFDLDGEVKVNLGAAISAAGTCTLTLPPIRKAFPAGNTGAIVLDISPTVTLIATGQADVRATVTLRCGMEYRWSSGQESRVAYCHGSSTPLQASASSGVDVTATGALDTKLTWNGIAGLTGNLTGAAHAGYHPLSTPVGVIDAKLTGSMGACLACYWKGSPAHVTLVTGTIFSKVLATWGTVPSAPSSTPPSITTTSLNAGTLGAPYAQRLRTADNRQGAWSLSTGELPPGLSLVDDWIVGKPTALWGNASFTILFTDGRGLTDTQSLTLPVVAGASGGGAIAADAYCNANVIAANDDGSSEALLLPFDVRLGSTLYSTAYVGNNGYVTFDGPQGTYTPFPLAGSGSPIIAPYFADVDTRAAGSPLVTFGISPDNKTLCVNWLGVGYFAEHMDKTIDVQLLLTSRAELGAGDIDVTFNYGHVGWETGDASDGAGGIGGVSARAGWGDADGNGGELPGSGVSGALLDGGSSALVSGSRGGATPGRYLFAFRTGTP
ncbi:nidogen-like domain-containing protein [Humibacillus xanthopallidus]|uniref:nidogen-like domain-containing protein n=1 Tax=Humibacillus xanthopallidus TaxID=412689 RepID=UPI00385136B4